MNLKTWLPLCLAVVLGLVAAKVTRDTLAKNQKQESNTGVLTQVVVAKRTIMPGEELNADNLSLGGVSATAVPESSFRNVAEVQGRVPQIQLGKGQPVVEQVLAAQGSGVGLAAVIPNGMRAITIEVNEFSGVGGMLLPGSHVDVLATVPSESGEMLARTIVQNVAVTAVGQMMVSQPKKQGDEPVTFRSVTLLATPTEAEAIELAATSGRPRLVLRGGLDKAFANTAGVSVSNLRGRGPRQVKVESNSKTTVMVIPTVKVIRAGVESEVRFDSVFGDPKVSGTGTDAKVISSTDKEQAVPGR
ncbi:MAG: Flp pilus assembly protein CpaB [Tepidisphaeraceae bacterium]